MLAYDVRLGLCWAFVTWGGHVVREEDQREMEIINSESEMKNVGLVSSFITFSITSKGQASR